MYILDSLSVLFSSSFIVCASIYSCLRVLYFGTNLDARVPWSQPGADTDMNRLKLGLAEVVYHSTKREPLGKSYQRGHELPQKVRQQ